MELDSTKAAAAFVLVLAIGVAALFVLPAATPMAPMATDTILMMVLPSMAIFGAIMLAIGVAHGRHRATR